MLEGFDDDHRPLQLISRGRAVLLAWQGNQSRPDRQFAQRRANSIAVPATTKAFLLQVRGNLPTQPVPGEEQRSDGEKSLARAGSTASRNAAPSSARPPVDL